MISELLSDEINLDWKSCTMKKLEIWKFGIQVFFSTLMIGLCSSLIFMERQNSQNQAVYWSGLSGVLAYWLPSPASAGESRKSED